MRYLMVLIPFLIGVVIPVPTPDLVHIQLKHPMTLYTRVGRPVTLIVCAKTMARPLQIALSCVAALEDPVELFFHGCHVHRRISGTERWSLHAYGIAIDLNDEASIPPRMVDCFEDAGFEWGGRWPRHTTYDPIHFQLRGGDEVRP